MLDTAFMYNVGDEVVVEGIRGVIAEVSQDHPAEYTIYTPFVDLRVSEGVLINNK